MKNLPNENQERQFTILLVDDRPENNLLLEEVLEKENRQFLKANSGNEALKILLKNPDIGLVMLDVQMPDMDGFEVAGILKSNPKTRDVAIIFVTAINKEEQYVLKGFEEGAVDYLQKPLDINVTRAKVNVFERLYFSQLELQESLSELEKVNKQMEKFMYVVSHDLKSPLASIITILSTLRGNSTIESNNMVNERIEMVSTAAYHLSSMIDSLLEYSMVSLKQQSIEEVNTAELANQVAFLLFPPKNISVKVQEDMPVLKTRKLKLQQVFQNLISNAIKYNDKPEGLIEIGAVEKNDFYEFFVRDNGPGIASQDKDRIFKLFSVTENKAKRESSTGVGLNILKLLVEEQGGKIWVDSEQGNGSTFYFEWRKEA